MTFFDYITDLIAHLSLLKFRPETHHTNPECQCRGVVFDSMI